MAYQEGEWAKKMENPGMQRPWRAGGRTPASTRPLDCGRSDNL